VRDTCRASINLSKLDIKLPKAETKLKAKHPSPQIKVTPGIGKIDSLPEVLAIISQHCSPINRMEAGKINYATMVKYSQHAKVSAEGGQVGAALGYFGFALEYFVGACVSWSSTETQEFRAKREKYCRRQEIEE
jgi:hypothetical protein